MILIAHIVFSLVSVIYVSYTALFPSTTKLRAAYFSMAGTITSGILVVLSNTSYLGRACVSGIAYFGIMLAVSSFARKRLANSYS